MYSFQLHFWLFTVFRANVRYWASLSNNRVPPPTTTHPLLKCKGLNLKCHLNIRKHRPFACILGFIQLPYFGSEQFRQIYLVERICICIWIDVFVFVFESKLNKIFVFVFVFEKSKFLYLYLYLIKRIWPQPCKLLLISHWPERPKGCADTAVTWCHSRLSRWQPLWLSRWPFSTEWFNTYPI